MTIDQKVSLSSKATLNDKSLALQLQIEDNCRMVHHHKVNIDFVSVARQFNLPFKLIGLDCWTKMSASGILPSENFLFQLELTLDNLWHNGSKFKYCKNVKLCLESGHWG